MGRKDTSSCCGKNQRSKKVRPAAPIHRISMQRTFGWLRRQRRLANDYERMVLTSETLIKAAMISLMSRRLASSASIL